MSVEFVPLPERESSGSWRLESVRLAASMAAAFAGRNLHIGASRVVHAVSWAEWVDGHELPVPSCRQGFAGTGTHGELTPTRHPVSCRRCRRLHGDEADERQAALFPLD